MHAHSSLQQLAIVGERRLNCTADFEALAGYVDVGVPIPQEHAAAGEQIEKAIQQALKETEDKHIIGSNITPYLLQRVQELTSGASLTANIQLIKNNAQVGSQIAVSLAQQAKQ